MFPLLSFNHIARYRATLLDLSATLSEWDRLLFLFVCASASLLPHSRPNLDVLTHVHVTRVLLDDDNKATGVEYRAPDGRLR